MQITGIATGMLTQNVKIASTIPIAARTLGAFAIVLLSYRNRRFRASDSHGAVRGDGGSHPVRGVRDHYAVVRPVDRRDFVNQGQVPVHCGLDCLSEAGAKTT